MELVSWGCRLQAFILQVVLVGSEAERRGGGGGGGGVQTACYHKLLV